MHQGLKCKDSKGIKRGGSPHPIHTRINTRLQIIPCYIFRLYILKVNLIVYEPGERYGYILADSIVGNFHFQDITFH